MANSLVKQPLGRSQPRIRWSMSRVWDMLTHPHPQVIGIERRQARLLALILLFLTTSFAVGVFIIRPFQLSAEGQQLAADPIFQIAFPLLLIMFTTYLTSRTIYYRIAAGITAFAFYSGALATTALSSANVNVSGVLSYLAVGVLLSSIFLPLRVTLLVGLLDLVTIAIYPMLDPRFSFDQVAPSFAINLLLSAMIALYAWHRDAVERDRTNQLLEMNDQLGKASAEAERAALAALEANRLKSEFLATMSHELRTPLNAILMFSNLLLMGASGPLSSDVTNQMTRINANGKRLLTLINDVLDLAKIEARRVEVVLRPMALRSLVEELQATMGVLAIEKGLEFSAYVSPRVPERVVVDNEFLKRMVVNLLSNAFKFTDKGGVTLAVNVEGSGRLIIQVADTGIGITSHALEFIFDEFRQVDGTTQRSYGGTGLGLALVKQYAILMNGHVAVKSKVGVGSEFTIDLPLILPDGALMPIVEEAEVLR